MINFSWMGHFAQVQTLPVSKNVYTYPSPNLKLTQACYQLTVVGSGEG